MFTLISSFAISFLIWTPPVVDIIPAVVDSVVAAAAGCAATDVVAVAGGEAFVVISSYIYMRNCDNSSQYTTLFSLLICEQLGVIIMFLKLNSLKLLAKSLFNIY